jgi:hypothetical protein
MRSPVSSVQVLTCRFFYTSNFSTSLSSFNSACVSLLLFAVLLLIVPPPPLQHTYSAAAASKSASESVCVLLQGEMSTRGLVVALQTASAAVHSTWQASGRAVGLGEQEVVRLLQALQHAMRSMVPQPPDQDRTCSLWNHLVACRDRDRVLQVLVVCAERVVSVDSSGSECLRERVWLVTALNRHALAKATEIAFPAGYADELRDGVASALAALDSVAFNIAFSHSSPEQLAFPEFQPQSLPPDPAVAVNASAATKVCT